jgi:hypothetical protein
MARADKESEQHPGENMRPTSVASAVIGLYLTCERAYSGRQVQHKYKISGAPR